MSEWFWCGHAHHFVAADSCRFHLATFIGDYLVSTVGDYRRDNGEGRREIGSGRFFETYVFRTDGNFASEDQHPVVSDWMEIEADGYQTSEEANLGHLALCRKYAALVTPPAKGSPPSVPPRG